MKAVLIALTAAALAAGSSAALAAKKHGGGGPADDPRMKVVSKGSQSWCNLDSSCNGWGAYMDGISKHQKFSKPTMVIPTL